MKNWPANYWLRLLVGLFSAIGLVVVALLMSREAPTKTETTLLNFLTFIFSISASWIFSKLYSEATASENLRDYGVQVARGVMVLQAQIGSLNRWISTKRQELPTDLATSVTSAQFEHIEETLRGFQAQADATLRGIASVIGDAFKQYEDTISQISQLREREAIERDKIIREAKLNPEYGESADSSAERYEFFQQKIEELEQRTTDRISELVKTTSFPIDIRQERTVNVRCPVCGTANQCSISPDPGSTRRVTCYSCRSDFNVHIDSSGTSFVRLISGRIPVAHPALINEIQAEDDREVAYCLSCIRKRISATEFVILTKFMTNLLNSVDVNSMQYTITELGKKLSGVDEVSSAMPAKRIGEYLQMLFWGRYFSFVEQPGFHGKIFQTSPTTYSDVMRAFFKAVGYNFAKTGIAINEARDREDILRYGPGLSPDEISDVYGVFSSSYQSRVLGE